jgi:hypothetical protein
MARKLKTFEPSLGFFDLAIAAPSMKAALEAWRADSQPLQSGCREGKRRSRRRRCDHGQTRRRSQASRWAFQGACRPAHAPVRRRAQARIEAVSREAKETAAGKDRRQGSPQGRTGFREGGAAARRRAAKGRGRQARRSASGASTRCASASRVRQNQTGA